MADAPEYAAPLAEHRRFMREWVEANGDTLAAAYIMR